LVTLENALNIFVDGSSFGSPRRGGIGIRFVIIELFGEEKIKDFEFAGYMNATNNQMELQACILALKEAMKSNFPKNITRIVIQSDSFYVVDNYRKAMFQWPNTQWLTPSGRPVLNADLWKELVKCIQKIHMRVEIRWVKGHSKSKHNKAVDKLARASANMPFHKPLTHVSVRRKKSSKSVDVGSVKMQGQRITIRIITSEYLNIQRFWKYKYEVISKQSRYKGNIDFIFSEHFLSTGHTYYVRVNSDTINPRIEKIFREITTKKAFSPFFFCIFISSCAAFGSHFFNHISMLMLASGSTNLVLDFIFW
jgi:ribonuclease HI